MYSEQDKDRILAYNDHLVDVIGDFVQLTKKGNKYLGECPGCGKDKGLEISTEKKIYKCFSCGNVSGNNAVSFLMRSQNKSFPEALEYLNHKYCVVIEPTPVPKKAIVKKETGKPTDYCRRMLTESGLTDKDVKATVFKADENKTITTSNVFKSGTVNSHFEVISGDDVIIEYYDLEGFPVKYEVKNDKGKLTGKYKEFFRVRYQFPDEHKDKSGKPAKYKSPYGSGNFLYIPEKIRELYRTGQKLDVLFLQEGEKKAEKACKHGIFSVGISGINNIAMDGKLPEDLIKIIQKLEVKEVVFLFDADWNEISNNLKINDSVDKRPRNFFYAAKGYKEYMRMLKNRDIYVEIYIGHVKKNEKGDKGIDDLLSNTLKTKEETLKEDIGYLMNEKTLEGKFLKLWKITSWNDNKLEELWKLNNPQAFANEHKEVLKHLPEFKIGKHLWKFNAAGEIESAQPIESDEKYWDEVQGYDRNGNPKPTTYDFKYGRCFTFLQNRGFGRYRRLDGTYQYIHINHPTVRVVEPYEIRDYVTEFTKVVANENVLEMLYRGGVQYLGPDKLSNLNFIAPSFEEPSREMQRLYFKNSAWEIKGNQMTEIDYSIVNYNIWNDQRHEFPAQFLAKPLIDVHLSDDQTFSYKISEEGKRCQFLQFLVNTSNFTWRKEKQLSAGDNTVQIDADEKHENILHLISKLAAFGYLTLSAKDRNVSRAVVAMDGKQSEVGQSNGRSGKSILGEAMKQTMKTLYIDGKKKDIEGDIFIWDGMDEKYKGVFLDDVRTNFSLEFLFANITGDWNVNWKGGRRFTIPFALSPKIYITTNHALNGRGSSFMDRQYIIAFSDFYNDEHKPKDDFGGLFFDDWDFDQWNLFWNLLANCIQIYLKYGCVQAPSERIATRQLRQDMGETFLSWADEYFSEDIKLNCRLVRKTLYDEYIKYSNLPPKLMSPTAFKNKVKAFCQWKEYTFNAHMYDPTSGKPLKYDKDGKPDLDDKSGGVEYFYIGSRPITASDIITTTENGMVVPNNKDDKPF